MVNLGKISVGDVNTSIQIVVEETSVSDTNAVIDFSADPADTLQIIIVDPDDNESTHTAVILNSPGTDGIIAFVNSDYTLFDEPGAWRMKPKITFSDGGIFTGNPITFEVLG